MAESLGQQEKEFLASGGEVKTCPPGKKPAGKTLDYPLSGGGHPVIKEYETPPERSPILKLLVFSPKGLSITGPGGTAKITMEDVATALAAMTPTRFVLLENVRLSDINKTDKAARHIVDESGIVHEKLNSRAYTFALAKYLDDKKALGQCAVNIWMEAGDLARKNGWKIDRGKEVLRNASEFALARQLNVKEHFQCQHCNGSGANRQGICPHCKGACRHEISWRKLTEFLGMSDHKNVKKVWSQRIEMIEAVIRRWDLEVVSHLYYQFGPDGDGNAAA